MLAERMLRSLHRAVEKMGAKTRVSQSTGVSQSLVVDYTNGRKKAKDMTLATFEKLLPVLDDIHVTYGERPATTIPAELTTLLDNWKKLPKESQEHIRFMIDATLAAHGIKGDRDSGSSRAVSKYPDHEPPYLEAAEKPT